MEEYLSPTDTARRLGTTVKALKVYERLGLVQPLRSASGWRLYGPSHIVRLHEVLALKQLGLGLAAIGTILAGRAPDLDRTLALQEATLRDRRRDLDRLLRRVRQVRAQLAAGDALSTAELLAVVKDTTETPPHWSERMLGYYRRHLGDSGLARLKPGDPELWAGLVAELKTLSAADVSPAAPAARDFFRRWAAASRAVSGGDPELNLRAHAAWMEAIEARAPDDDLPLGKAELDYLARLAGA